ncbi:MAG: GNAT family N-acetyltransferase [Sulfurimonas sp.]|nr:GNAT family N-acetyltransferase [Sulfurimonas sp.]
MKPTLYFLRSSEQKIVTDMLYYAYRLDETDKKVRDFPELETYSRFYGLSSKDLGLYALSEHKIAGGAWIRLLREDEPPILTIGVKPEFRKMGIGSAMLEQLFLEAGAIFESMSVTVLNNEKSISFFKKHGFVEVENSLNKSLVDESEVIAMLKELPKARVVRPMDGYNPQKWMD